MHDVVVVGGGPGGLHTARVLAARGFDVAVFEEHAVSGDPVHCTGVLAADAFDEFHLPRTAILNELRTVRFFAPSGHAVSHTTPRVEAVAIDRLVFDSLLARDAAAAGATLVAGTRVEGIDPAPDAVTIRLSSGAAVSGRVCILACGANYRLQQRLGLGIPRLFLQSAQLELPAPGAANGDVEVHVGGLVAPRGFAWIVPVRRHDGGWYARVGLMCDRDAPGHFRRFAAGVRSRLGLTFGDAAALRPRRKMLPLAPIARTYANRVVAIGDAAGIVKATTGGGIYYGILSAQIAAEEIAAALPSGALAPAALARYEGRWRARLGAELDAQLKLRGVADRLNDDDIEELFELARTDGIMPIVRRTARFNHHRAVIMALFRHPPVRRLLFDRLRGERAYTLHAGD